MKRVGKRGEGKWQRISFEQLIKEVVEGGDLFGEGHVDGLRAIHDPITPLDAKHPGFGPKSINCWSPIPATRDAIRLSAVSH